MSIHDPLFITAEVEHRLELAGVHRDGHPEHHADAPAPLAAHPVAAFVARLLGGRTHDASPAHHGAHVATRRPRHP